MKKFFLIAAIFFAGVVHAQSTPPGDWMPVHYDEKMRVSAEMHTKSLQRVKRPAGDVLQARMRYIYDQNSESPGKVLFMLADIPVASCMSGIGALVFRSLAGVEAFRSDYLKDGGTVTSTFVDGLCNLYLTQPERFRITGGKQ